MSPGGPLGLMFHYFHDGEKHPPAQGTISSAQFERIIDQVGSDAGMLSAEEWARKAESGRLGEHDVCVTFDDALRSQFDVALPVLRRRGLTAFWFIQSGALTGDAGQLEAFRRFRNEHFDSVEGFYQAFHAKALERKGDAVNAAVPGDYLQAFAFYTDADRRFRFVRDRVLRPEEYAEIMQDLMRSKNTSVKELSSGMLMDEDCLHALESEGNIIGLHSHSHPTCLADLPADEQRAEYQTNYEVLSGILAKPPFTMAHPCNSYSGETLEILRSLGIRIGFRANTALRDYSCLEFPRMDSADLVAGTKQ